MPAQTSRLIAARFLARPNRFIVRAELPGGRSVDAHLGDPGRLVELLVPGAPLRLRPAPPSSTRRTRHTVALVRASQPPRAWVSVETLAANRLAEGLITAGSVRGVGPVAHVAREVRHGRSRFDFRVEPRRGGPILLEVKSVTLVEGGVARFPDAPTARGRRHLEELTEHARSGGRAFVLFVVQREDARRVEPHRGIDPEFAAALAEARRSGVRLRAARFRLSAAGNAFHMGPLPVSSPGVGMH